ncbi:acyltransferase [Aliivibrio logei]|uniref:Chemotaxis protein CheW n=1 Tax=Aliivibrio logei 5S-186 TaxID=626086 RepID=A0ABX3AQN8_ALILO|nr:acyltransferase [Aliivibrio logei]OEF10076.1 chemotaxis protein CheW [Aliivibrio logei 5S-186]
MVNVIKFNLQYLSLIHCFYFVLFYKLGFKYKTITIMLSKWSGYYGIILRQSFYKITLNKCGKNLKVFHGSYICYESVEIGDNCTIEEDSVISNCIIGDNVIIAAKVSLMSGKNHHDIDQLDKTFYETQSNTLDKIILGNNIWVGTHSIIMNNVANGIVIGAGSVVNKIIDEDNIIVAGVPAKKIRKRG